MRCRGGTQQARGIPLVTPAGGRVVMQNVSSQKRPQFGGKKKGERGAKKVKFHSECHLAAVWPHSFSPEVLFHHTKPAEWMWFSNLAHNQRVVLWCQTRPFIFIYLLFAGFNASGLPTLHQECVRRWNHSVDPNKQTNKQTTPEHDMEKDAREETLKLFIR